MMYSNRFIASVRVNGKILRENQGAVSLPFGAEYELLLKNMNSRRAMVKVSVDGVDVTGGTRLIIEPNSSTSIERFIKDGNFTSGNKLKFIERTGGIESHRGIKQDDGLIRCEFWAEKERVQEITETIVRRRYVDEWPFYPSYPLYPRPYYGPWTLGGITYTSNSGNISGQSGEFTKSSVSSYGGVQNTQNNVTAQNMNSATNSAAPPTRMLRSFAEQERSAPINDAGITVAGSESHQQFYSASGFPLEANSHVIVLQLRGEVGGVAVAKPITVDIKPECSTCGRKNKANAKFCTDCGTALIFI